MVGITEKQADRDCCGFGTGCSVAAAMPLEAPWRGGVVLWRWGRVFVRVNQVLVRLWARCGRESDRMPCGIQRPGTSVQRRLLCAERE